MKFVTVTEFEKVLRKATSSTERKGLEKVLRETANQDEADIVNVFCKETLNGIFWVFHIRNLFGFSNALLVKNVQQSQSSRILADNYRFSKREGAPFVRDFPNFDR